MALGLSVTTEAFSGHPWMNIFRKTFNHFWIIYLSVNLFACNKKMCIIYFRAGVHVWHLYENISIIFVVYYLTLMDQSFWNYTLKKNKIRALRTILIRISFARGWGEHDLAKSDPSPEGGGRAGRLLGHGGRAGFLIWSSALTPLGSRRVIAVNMIERRVVQW